MFSTTSGSILSSAQVKGGQVQGKDCFLPGNFQPIQVEFGQSHKVPRGGKRSAGQKHMQMRMPMQQLSVSLDGGDHARHDAGTVAEPTNASRRCPKRRLTSARMQVHAQ